MDMFLQEEESESCLSCTWYAYWSVSSSLPNMKAIHWLIKVTHNFEKKVKQKVNLGWHPMPTRTSLFQRTDFFEKPVQKINKFIGLN